ncbi:hypothetical protein DOY81_013442, partial [Sarcophaga bullata]
DGHREKTLSLLWQIIYKFRSPKFHAAAKVIQVWWRKSWLKVLIRRRIRYKEQQKRESAAIKIQSYYRGFTTRHFAKQYREERTKAAIVFQKYIRRYLARKTFRKTVTSCCFNTKMATLFFVDEKVQRKVFYFGARMQYACSSIGVIVDKQKSYANKLL